MSQETEVRFAYTSLGSSKRPDVPFWTNRMLIMWSQGAGYDSAEFHPFRTPVIEVLRDPVKIVSSLEQIRSGHVRPNPYATMWKFVKREPDPLRPDKKLQAYNLAFAEPSASIKALRKLEDVRDPDLHVVTYPYTVSGERPYGEYKRPLLQTHPYTFNDESTADDIIKSVRSGDYAGVVWDTYHALEQTESGNRPLGDWRKSLWKLLEAGVVNEMHVQVGRVHHDDPSIPSFEWLRGMLGENPSYNSEVGQMIKMAKDYNPTIPFVIEVTPEGLVEAGIIGKRFYKSPTLESVKSAHRGLIDFVKRV